MKVYLAGKITGDPNYREKFAAAVKKLEEKIFSPVSRKENEKIENACSVSVYSLSS